MSSTVTELEFGALDDRTALELVAELLNDLRARSAAVSEELAAGDPTDEEAADLRRRAGWFQEFYRATKAALAPGPDPETAKRAIEKLSAAYEKELALSKGRVTVALRYVPRVVDAASGEELELPNGIAENIRPIYRHYQIEDLRDGDVLEELPIPVTMLLRTVRVTDPARLELPANFASSLASALSALPGAVVNVDVSPTPVTIKNTVELQEEPTNLTVDFKRNPSGTIKSAKVTEDV